MQEDSDTPPSDMLRKRAKRDVLGDGNCLFRAVSIEYLRTEEVCFSHDYLRHAAAGLSGCFKDLMIRFPGMWSDGREGCPSDPDRYEAFLSRDAVWGTTFDIHLLCNLLDFRCIYVILYKDGLPSTCYKIHPIPLEESSQSIHAIFRQELVSLDTTVSDEEIVIGGDGTTHFWAMPPPTQG